MLQLSETMNKVKILIVEQGDTFEFSQVERPKKKTCSLASKIT